MIFKDIDPTQIQFKQPIPLHNSSDGAKFIPIRYQCQELFFQSPQLPTPFGLNYYQGAADGVTISLTDMDIDPTVRHFCQLIEGFESRIQEIMSPSLFKSVIRQKEHYDKQILLKFLRSKGQITTQFFDEKQQPCTYQSITANGSIKCLIQLSGVVVHPEYYSCSLLIHQARVHPPNRFIGYSLLSDTPVQQMNVDQILATNPQLLDLFRLFQQFNAGGAAGGIRRPAPPAPSLIDGVADSLPIRKPERRDEAKLPRIQVSPHELLAQRSHLRPVKKVNAP